MANGSGGKLQSRMFHPQIERWSQGDLVQCEGKIWRVGMVSDMRMRLDPVSGFVTTIGDVSFPSYTKSINVSPNSVLDRVEEESLSEGQRRRVEHLIVRETAGVSVMTETEQQTVDTEESETMAEETVVTAPATAQKTPVAAKAAAGGVTAPKMAPAAQPVAVQPTVSDNKKKNQERLAQIKAAKDAKTAAKGTTAKPSPVAKTAKALSPCKCGCGTLVAGNFAQGHDARFKSWLLKVERGEMQVKELPPTVQKAYQWVKKGDGMVPTTNYKGEKHTGYDKE